MKKLLTGLLALTLAASTSIPAFAAENSATNDGSTGTDIAVSGAYKAADAPAEKISVDLAWEAMDFTYTAPSKGEWNATEHKYENATAGGWAATGGTDPKITVTNHSNVDVKADFTFDSMADGVTGSFTEDSLILVTAEGTDHDNAPTGEAAFSVSGSAIDADQTLGTITVTVAKFGGAFISTAEQLLATANKTGTFLLVGDIDLGNERLGIESENYVLDLNGNTLSGCVDNFSMIRITGGNVTIKNGTVHNTSDTFGEGIETFSDKFILENCKSVSFLAALYISHKTVAHITDCEIQTSSPEHFSFVNQSDLTLSGNVNVEGGGGFSNQGGTVKALPGTYNFDISSYVDTTLYDVTSDGTTWTVTAK